MSKKKLTEELDETVLDETYGDEEYEETEEKTSKRGGYKFGLIVLLLLGVAGLFAGMLAKFIPEYRCMISTSEGVFQNTFLGFIIDTFKVLFNAEGAVAPAFGFVNEANVAFFDKLGFMNYFAYAFAGAVALSLILTIIGLISRKAARGCYFISATLLLLAYGGFAITCYTLGALCGMEALAALDYSSLFVTAALLLTLFITGLARIKARAIYKLIILAVTLFTYLCFFYEKSATLVPMRNVFVLGLEGSALAEQCFLLIFCGFAVLGLIASLISVVKKGYKCQTVFLTFFFISALALHVFYVTRNGVDDLNWNVFKNISTICFVCAAFLAFLLSLIGACVVAARKKKAQAAEEYEDEEEYEEEEAVPAAAVAPAAPVAPVAAAAKHAQPAHSAAPVIKVAPIVIIAPADKYYRVSSAEFEREMTKIAQENAEAAAASETPLVVDTTAVVAAPAVKKEEPAAAPATPEPAPAPAPAPAPLSAKELKAQKKAEKKAKKLAKKAAKSANTQVEAQPAPAAVEEPVAEAEEAPVVEEPAAPAEPVVYDAFLETLTESEKQEFTELFIDRTVINMNGVPGYRIGTENKEFFSKVFVYLGKFRPYVSSNLLGKILDYRNK